MTSHWRSGHAKHLTTYLCLSCHHVQAKKKTIEVLTVEETGVDFTPRNKVVKVEEPSTRKAGVFVDTPSDLIDKLRNEASVI